MSPDGALLGVQSSLFRHCVVIGGISVRLWFSFCFQDGERLWFSFLLFKVVVCFNQLGHVRQGVHLNAQTEHFPSEQDHILTALFKE